jgi:two-component system response regulator AtoC
VLQEKEFERVGGTKCIKVDVRILAATNRNLKQMVEEGNFREDLYYRVNVVNIKLPPLRERKEDIPLLLNYYLSKSARKYNKDISGISKEAMAVLKNYNWPGNVRELKNVCEQAVVMSRGPAILLEDLPLSGNGDLVLGNGNANTSIIVNNGRTLKEIVADVEKQVILKALNDNQWNRQETAKALGLNRRSLYAKMKEYNLL